MENKHSFRIFVYKTTDDTYTAVCLDLDIVEEKHSSMIKAVASIQEAVSSHVNAISKIGFPKELVYRPAPKEYWDKLEELSKPETSKTLPFHLQRVFPSVGQNTVYA